VPFTDIALVVARAQQAMPFNNSAQTDNRASNCNETIINCQLEIASRTPRLLLSQWVLPVHYIYAGERVRGSKN